MYDPQSAVSAGQSYHAHLDSLREFARELQTQLDAVGRTADHIADPSTATVELGDFNEAATLKDRHAIALEEMRALLEDVQAAISFAERVTGVVANSYAGADQDAAAAFGRVVST